MDRLLLRYVAFEWLAQRGIRVVFSDRSLNIING